MTASGCTVCWRHMVSSAMFLNPPAISSTAEPDGPRRTGSMRRAMLRACGLSGLIPSSLQHGTLPTPEEEDAKRTHREREKLVQERLRIQNRIEALLFTQGIQKRPSLRSRGAMICLFYAFGDGCEIPRHLRAELDRLRRRLVMTCGVDPGGRGRARFRPQKTKPQDQAYHKIAALCRIRGIGENFAAVLTREVFYRPFDNRRKIASYVGITQCPTRSGGMDRDRRISRQTRRARTTMIQLAWLWLARPAWQRAGEVVPRARRHAGRAHTTDRHCGYGAQAADRALALRRDRV